MSTLLFALAGFAFAAGAGPWLQHHRDRVPPTLAALWWAPCREAWVLQAGHAGGRRALTLGALCFAGITGQLRFLVFAMLLGPLMHVLDQRGLKKWRQVQDEELPEGLRALSGDLRRGATLGQAVRLQASTDPGPLGPLWQRAVDENELGRSLPKALMGMAQRVGLRGLEQAALAMTIAEQSGGKLATVLDEVADSVASLVALDGKLHALTAQGRLQLLVMAGLPLVFAVYLAWSDPEGMALMLNTPQGMLVCSAVVSCEIVGVILFRKVLGVSL